MHSSDARVSGENFKLCEVIHSKYLNATLNFFSETSRHVIEVNWHEQMKNDWALFLFLMEMGNIIDLLLRNYLNNIWYFTSIVCTIREIWIFIWVSEFVHVVEYWIAIYGNVSDIDVISAVNCLTNHTNDNFISTESTSVFQVLEYYGRNLIKDKSIMKFWIYYWKSEIESVWYSIRWIIGKWK